ncbi:MULTISPECIES: multidrug ABC transporter permease/ATP-binding protein [unclassified Psychrobacter]|uniref:multidrug ABC transporter permease/ATP-binding protein n=1 Tax=unclassified Psychrobacter TaxID=196806 RepID=UPI0025B35A64|nr:MULTISPECIES: multidrug ABC transporter permease/ATP-binding protein [unclassified Psychrobacter]MDN3453288.1 multidrug ABC transporter permease/ATP-binding protein [Psychrobacter sp. APC 3350]MDN3503127.1 multidrug ABC transporter permease/ATP-binding protein [Psychrobacter sp. 5A.1]
MSSRTTASLYHMIWANYRLPFLKVILLNLINAAVSVGIIAYINHTFISQPVFDTLSWLSLGYFSALIALLLVTTFLSQYALTCLGHQFVYELRTKLVKQIIDTKVPQIDHLGSARLIASLSSDIQSITTAFVRMPELVQGVILSAGVALYLGWLSLPLLFIIMFWIVMTIWISTILVKHVYTHLIKLRAINDFLYQDYQSIIEGRKGLALNQYRAEKLYSDDFLSHAKSYQQTVIKSDTFHLSAVNWSNIMMFASIGVVFAVSNYLDIPMGVATTFSLTILFMQSPILHAVGAYPTLQTAQVALDKIQSLELADYQAEFMTDHVAKDWHSISLTDVGYRYGGINTQTQELAGDVNNPDDILKSVNLTVRRGDVVFLIGANGSGKSTLAKIITGIFTPTTGSIHVDQGIVDSENNADYRQLFSAIFSDQHLFKQLIGDRGNQPDEALISDWLQKLNLQDKVSVADHQLSTDKLSQGQRKRLAMLLSVAEQKDILLLDEWAADQDPAFRRVFYQTLIPELKAMGKTLFIISHDDSYFEHADRLLLMKEGRLIELNAEERQHASTDAIAMLQ